MTRLNELDFVALLEHDVRQTLHRMVLVVASLDCSHLFLNDLGLSLGGFDHFFFPLEARLVLHALLVLVDFGSVLRMGLQSVFVETTYDFPFASQVLACLNFLDFVFINEHRDVWLGVGASEVASIELLTDSGLVNSVDFLNDLFLLDVFFERG